MKKLAIVITFLSLVRCDINKNPFTFDDTNFGYEYWPKDGVIRSHIELPVSTFMGYGLKLAPGFNDSNLYFELPLSAGNTEELGRFEISIYPDIEKAQLALVEFMYTMQTPFKPPMLKKKEFSVGDVAFGMEVGDVFRVFFARDNVMVILEAEVIVSKELAQKIDDVVLSSSSRALGNIKPSFIITDELLQAFYNNTQ